MISTLILSLPLCVGTVSLEAQELAPCSGVLWSVENTKKALKCRQVELPTALAGWQLCKQTKAIEVRRLETKLATANQIIDAVPPAAPAWVLPVVSVGSFLAGALSVVLLTR